MNLIFKEKLISGSTTKCAVIPLIMWQFSNWIYNIPGKVRKSQYLLRSAPPFIYMTVLTYSLLQCYMDGHKLILHKESPRAKATLGFVKLFIVLPSFV